MLSALEARPEAPVYGPDVEVDVALVHRYAAQGRFAEARALLAGSGLESSAEGRAVRDALEVLLEPLASSAPAVAVEALQCATTRGPAAALALLDEGRNRNPGTTTGEVERIRRALEWFVDPWDEETRSGGQRSWMEALRAYVASGDWTSAARLVGDVAHRSDEGARAMKGALDHVVAFVAAPSPPSEQDAAPWREAVGALRAGRLADAERALRRLLLAGRTGEAARGCLDALRHIRNALDPSSLTQRGVSAATPDAVAPTLPGDAAEQEGLRETLVDGSAATARGRTFAGVEHSRGSATGQRDHPEPTDEIRAPSTPPPSTERLLRKHAQSGPSAAEGWSRPVTAARFADDWEGAITSVSHPEERAEQLLRHGHYERAAWIYERLAAVQPRDAARLIARARQIREAGRQAAVSRVLVASSSTSEESAPVTTASTCEQSTPEHSGSEGVADATPHAGADLRASGAEADPATPQVVLVRRVHVVR